MDLPTVALCAQMAWQHTSEEKYREMRDEFISLISRKTTDGGFYLPIASGSAWLSEYSERSTNAENEMYVLNGFLVALQSIYMLAESTQSSDLLQLYSDCLNHYKAISGKFWLEDGKWSYYMLQPKESIPPHYMIFETKQLNALHKLHPNEFYKTELEKHRAALKGMLPVYAMNEGATQKQFVLHRAILDPYLVDIYQTEIDFFDSSGNLISTASSEGKGSYLNTHFMTGSISKFAIRYNFYAINSAGIRFFLFDGELKKNDAHKKNGSNLVIKSADLNISADYDGVMKNDLLSIEKGRSDKDEASLWIKLPEDFFDKNPESYFGLEIESDTENFIQLILYDSKSIGAHRSYRKLVPGKNLILVHWAGFYGIEDIGIPSQLRLRVFTENTEKDGSLAVKNIVKARNPVELFNYMKKTEFTINTRD